MKQRLIIYSVMVLLIMTSAFAIMLPDCNYNEKLFWFKVNSSRTSCSSVGLADITLVPSTGTLQSDAEMDFNNTYPYATCEDSKEMANTCSGLGPYVCYIGFKFSQIQRIKISPGNFAWRPTAIQTKTCCITGSLGISEGYNQRSGPNF